MQAVYLFLQAQAVIKLVLWAASTLQNTDGEQQALHKFSASWNLCFIKRKRFVPSKLTANYVLFDTKLCQVALRELGGLSRRSKSF